MSLIYAFAALSSLSMRLSILWILSSALTISASAAPPKCPLESPYILHPISVKVLDLPRPKDPYPGLFDYEHHPLKWYNAMAAVIIPSPAGGYDLYWRASMHYFSTTMHATLDSEFNMTSSPTSFSDIPINGSVTVPYNEYIKNKSGLINDTLTWLGPEDSRGFLNPQHETMLIYNKRDFPDLDKLNITKRATKSYLYNTATHREVRLRVEDEKDNEKNWTPIKYVNDTHVIIARYLDPLMLLLCDVETGVCTPYGADNPKIFSNNTSLRGGSPFYHYKGQFYYAMARVSTNICEPVYELRTYRPVFVIARLTEDGSWHWVYISEPLLLDNIATTAIKDDYSSKDFCEFKYILPYSVVLEKSSGLMHVTLNLRDRDNVIVTLQNVTSFIDKAIRDYDCGTKPGFIFNCHYDYMVAEKNGTLPMSSVVDAIHEDSTLAEPNFDCKIHVVEPASMMSDEDITIREKPININWASKALPAIAGAGIIAVASPHVSRFLSRKRPTKATPPLARPQQTKASTSTLVVLAVLIVLLVILELSWFTYYWLVIRPRDRS